jgi:hypothetical protein
LLTTLLRIHTTARRHCEAARRQQARVTAGGLRRSHARRGRKVWAKPATTPLACASARPPRHREVPEGGLHWRSSFRCRSLRCATHSTVHAKNAQSAFRRESNPLPHVLKVFDLPTGPKRLANPKLSGNGFRMVQNETHVVPRYPGYCEYSEYPPIRGSKSPRPAGALASLGGSSATRPLQMALGVKHEVIDAVVQVGGRVHVHRARERRPP